MEAHDEILPVAEATEDDAVHPVELGAERDAVPLPGEQAAPAEASLVYAIGQIDARFPSLSVEKEIDQVAATLDTAHLNERQVVKKVISESHNRYLARSLCWLLLVQGLETYILMPRDPRDYSMLINAYRENPNGDDVDVVIGTRGPIAPPEMCNGVAVPIVVFENLYSFTRKTLLESIPTPRDMPEADRQRFQQTAGGMFSQIITMADNAGATDEHRALNYLVVRYPTLYTILTEQNDRDASLSGIEVRTSPLTGVRKVVDVIFSFTDRKTDVVEKQFARVDVSETFPFLVTKLGPYFER